MRIAILHRSGQKAENVARYSIGGLEKRWIEKGHSVIHLFGPDRFIEADVALIHVDLSLVPEPYLRLARRYPAALNLQVTDIRKRRISQNLVAKEDMYTGPVIVKSDLNHGGMPEAYHDRRQPRPWYLRWKKRPRLSDFPEYRSYASTRKVPAGCWEDPLLVVEKFIPETADGFYFLRQSYFLGSRHRSWRLRSSQPIIRATGYIDDVEIPTPPEVQEFRRKLGLDYGKIDFVEHEGRISILDVNKTIGGSSEAVVTLDWLAPAIEEFGCTPVQV